MGGCFSVQGTAGLCRGGLKIPFLYRHSHTVCALQWPQVIISLEVTFSVMPVGEHESLSLVGKQAISPRFDNLFWLDIHNAHFHVCSARFAFSHSLNALPLSAKYIGILKCVTHKCLNQISQAKMGWKWITLQGLCPGTMFSFSRLFNNFLF